MNNLTMYFPFSNSSSIEAPNYNFNLDEEDY